MKQEFDALVNHFLTSKISLDEAIELLERKMIESALTRSGGKQTAAAGQLGIHRNTLQRKMVEYGLGNGRPRRKPVSAAKRIHKRKTGAA